MEHAAEVSSMGSYLMYSETSDWWRVVYMPLAQLMNISEGAIREVFNSYR